MPGSVDSERPIVFPCGWEFRSGLAVVFSYEGNAHKGRGIGMHPLGKGFSVWASALQDLGVESGLQDRSARPSRETLLQMPG